MENNIKKSMTMSLVVHALLLISLILLGGRMDGGKMAENGGNGNGGTKDVLLPPPSSIEVEIKEVKPTKEGTVPILKETIADKSNCKNSFGGIGIIYEPGSGRIFDVYDGYPASRAGLEVGDTIVNYNEIRGEPGTQVRVEVVRGGIRFTAIMTRSKVCYDTIQR